MKSAALRFWLLTALFAAWIGFLIYLALETRNPVILSRPQILASTLDVIADIDDQGEVKVQEVLWPDDQKGKLEGQPIKVTNLAACQPAKEHDVRKANEMWTEPGRYLLPLVKHGKDYAVATTPRSPAFEPARVGPRIYRVTPEVHAEIVRQVVEIRGLRQ
jgi:hypothetical protein